MRTTEERRASAMAPGHVTGLFAPDLAAADPRGRGSRGLGLVLDAGARAEAVWSPASRRTFRAIDERGRRLPLTEEALGHLLPPDAGHLSVVVHHDLPSGQGFGMSAAGTLAATLAAGRLVGVSRQRAVEVSHLSELFGGGGLGGVAAILGGGLEVRQTAGVPPWGRVDHFPFPHRVVVGIVGGPIPSPPLLANPRFLERVTRAAHDLADLGHHPSPEAFLAASERFTDRLHLAPAPLRSVLRGLRRRKWWAAQAMFGGSFFAVPRTARVRQEGLDFLEHVRVRAVELGTAHRGASVRRAPSGRHPRARVATLLTGHPSRVRP